MTERLPISIHLCDDLRQQFANIASISHKLAAQLNFQTMTANWYGDEEAILFVQLCVATPKNFLAQQKIQQPSDITSYADDAFSFYDNTEKERRLICYIAITDHELELLSQQHKLLAGLLQVKLLKVLNLIGQQLKLNTI